MRTSETLLLDFIRQSPQFRIPVNQRRYAWTQQECRQLWEDIVPLADPGHPTPNSAWMSSSVSVSGPSPVPSNKASARACLRACIR